MEESWHPEDKKAAPKRASVVDVKEYLDQHYADRLTLMIYHPLFTSTILLIKDLKNQFASPSLPTSEHPDHEGEAVAAVLSEDSRGDRLRGWVRNLLIHRVFKNVEGVSPQKIQEQW
jgi:hypothetical protein